MHPVLMPITRSRKWSQPNVDLLRELWLKHASTDLIVIRINNPEINADMVRWKAREIGLPSRREMGEPNRSTEYQRLRPGPRPRRKGAEPDIPIPPEDRFERYLEAFRPLPNRKPVPITDLKHTSCRWPIDDAHGKHAGFCGLRCEHNGLHPYCKTHGEMARPRD